MVRWLKCLLPIGLLIGQDDGLPPNFVYLEPIEDFYAHSPIELEIIVEAPHLFSPYKLL